MCAVYIYTACVFPRGDEQILGLPTLIAAEVGARDPPNKKQQSAKFCYNPDIILQQKGSFYLRY
jgi:hypothetical protein